MSNELIPISEGELKFAAEERLQYGMNQGKWYFDRLNSGEVIEVRGNTRRRVCLCREGTADFFVLDGWRCMVIFLEAKSKKGKQSPEQRQFQRLVEEQGAEYCIFRSLEELINILEVK